MASQHAPALDVAGVAERLDVSEWLVRKMIRNDELRHVRIGRLIRVPQSEVDRLLGGSVDQNATNTASASA